MFSELETDFFFLTKLFKSTLLKAFYITWTSKVQFLAHLFKSQNQGLFIAQLNEEPFNNI